jgi:hypothetical protein
VRSAPTAIPAYVAPGSSITYYATQLFASYLIQF